MNPTLAEFQRQFVQALQDDGGAAADPAWVRQGGFAVYRNTGRLACRDALHANYPVVARLVGADWFNAAAEHYLRDHPPADSRLLLYGERFPDFLEPLARAHDLPYLVEVARLDRAWTEAHAAADASPWQADQLAALPPEALPTLVLRPHPAARWHWSAQVPAYTLWSRHRADDEPSWVDLIWQGEGTLLTRAWGVVRWEPLSRAGCAFLQACADGLPLPRALQTLDALETQVDRGALLGRLLQQGAFQPPSDERTPA